MDDVTVIAKGRPADISMDYERLRAEGISHLERLATQIWTDFNAHDPGITILEVLCYAITDLGYRVNLPLPELIGTGANNGDSPFFLAEEVLSCHPVTPLDFRKVIIDVAGVKNAWLEKADVSLLAGRRLSFKTITAEQADELLKKHPIADETIRHEVEQILQDLQVDPPTEFKLQLLLDNYKKLVEAGQTEDADRLFQLLRELLCLSAFYRIKYEGDEDPAYQKIALNGLYRILLDLDDGLDPESDKMVGRVREAVLRRLHRHRNLCEDFAEIDVVKPRPICLCLDLELAPEVDPVEAVAEVIYRLQRFLTPPVHFYSFAQMRERGLPCDRIFNGPLLDNGFLPNDELERAELRPVIYRSDLYQVILDVPGVLAVKELQYKLAQEDHFNEEWCLDIQGEDLSVRYKPVIDLCCSCLYASKGVLNFTFHEDDLDEALETLRMADLNLVGRSQIRPALPPAQQREDLTDYLSVQYEFPATYALGEEGLPENASPLRRAQVRQLQAYLLFYDQILAAYLAQLAQVRNLLSVHQDPTLPTYFFQSLREVPGAAQLIRDFQPYEITDSRLDQLRQQQVEESIIAALENSAVKFFISESIFRQTMSDLLGDDWQSPQLQSLLRSALRREATAEDWELYWQEDNAYLDSLRGLTEDEATRRDRRNRLLDHLLARFGERFTDYALSLFPGTAASGGDSYLRYLQDKARFLDILPQLGAERGKAYNYRAFNRATGQPDVWNTWNVAGLKKRVYRLLGIEDFHTQSLFCDPDYDVRIQEGETRDGFTNYQPVLVHRESNEILLYGKTTRRRSRAAEQRQEMFQNAWRTEHYEVKPAGGSGNKYIVVFQYTTPDGVELLFESRPPQAEGQARNLHDRIVRLVRTDDCEREGFHLLEHILLRPNEPDDALLELALAPCPTHPSFPLPDGVELSEGLFLPEPQLRDPYSFWLTVILPDWPPRFSDPDFRRFFEQLFRRETPAHIAIRFCWLDQEHLLRFEPAFKRWREELAKCQPNECHVSEAARDLIELLNAMHCSCACTTQEEPDPKCGPCERSDEAPKAKYIRL